VDKDFRLVSCTDCKLAFFCSSECRSKSEQEHRVRQCADLKEHGEIELVRIKHTEATGEVAIQLPTQSPRTTYRPLSSAMNWKEFFEDISSSPFGSYITKDFGPADDNAEYQRICRFLKAAVDTSTYILTILAGLESELADLVSRTSLTIHIVGATEQELATGRMTEELFHLLPNLRNLMVGYIGPDIGDREGLSELLDFECCPNCQAMGRPPRKFFMTNALYHDFTQSRLFTQHPPDLIVAFHSGHYEAETTTWWPTVDRILDLGIPTLFTTYNEQEAVEEEKVLERKGAHFTKRMEKNRWSGVLPYFDNFVERYATYYLNGYWYIVKGRESK